MVEVIDKQVERLQALLQSGLDVAPLAYRHDPRDDVEGPGTVYVLAIAVDREGDPLVDDGQFCIQLACLQILVRQ